MAPNPDPNGFTPGNKNRTQIDTYIDGKLSEYREGSDHILWAAFTQDFKEWTVENLKTASVLRLAKLIVLLKSNGVYVDEAEQHRVAENVYAAAATVGPHTWTEMEVIDHLRKGRIFESPDINARFASVIAANSQSRGIAAAIPESDVHVRTVSDTPTPYQRIYNGAVTRSRSGLDPALEANTAPETPYPITRFSAPFTPALASRTTVGTTTQLQGIPESQEQQNPDSQGPRLQPQYVAYKQLQILLKIFYGYCRQNGLPNTPEPYREALPHMLKDVALSYYWDNIDQWIVQEKDPAEEIMARFEGPEHQRSTQSEWSDMTLDSVIHSNPRSILLPPGRAANADVLAYEATRSNEDTPSMRMGYGEASINRTRATPTALISRIAATIHVNRHARRTETAHRTREAAHKKEVNNDIQVAHHVATDVTTHRKRASYAEDQTAGQRIILTRNGQPQELPDHV
ncbi:hypothetical protein PMAA_008730 [Talaromyces marneffei ATCC 18224]|uniref:Uncharacterized protein n=1 Tax=Talaromyces marneffei (strain ATCC 18224 / CBS 334.59 / QM 7333) TaxID=441960 RepID=B6QUD0_TALMQ|nr:hypothetical protein PMAA_008730 [Talaromyces marneffei ATCC 18224]